MIVPVVLSGGSGTRLWPLSRRLRPKQLAPLVGERTMLQATVDRTDGLAGSDPIVVANVDHAPAIRRQLSGDPTLVLEPVGRNTAPAAAIAALAARRGGDDPVLVVLPADHVIPDLAAFRAAVDTAVGLAREGSLVTFGVVPTRPETGYGYIEQGEAVDGGGNRVARFVEKPDEATAARYVDAGTYLWNSGMFVFLASVYLEELERHRPEMAAAARAVYGASGWEGSTLTLDGSLAECPADSIDYAVMEHTDRAVVVPLDAGWNDVGAWPALWDLAEHDAGGNVLIGDVVAEGVADSYVRSGGGRLVAVVGLADVIVVDTPDAVLVCHRDAAQDVKAVVERLEAEGRPEVEDDTSAADA
jgi:mannose-1-phosphate guanylyltransferase/mannose-6-phosphate isomerase